MKKTQKIYEIEITETVVRKIQVPADSKEEAFDMYLDNKYTTETYTKSHEEITNHMREIGEFNFIDTATNQEDGFEDGYWLRDTTDIKISI